MPNNIVSIPYEYFADPDRGRPLFNAQIFVGQPDLDPEVPANQKQVTAAQEDGTEVSIPQPIRTNSGGYPVLNGGLVALLVDGEYSIKVLDRNGDLKIENPNVTNGIAITKDTIPDYTDLVFSNISNLKSGNTNGNISIDLSNLSEGAKVSWMGYYARGDGGANSGRLRFGVHTEDGGSIFSIDSNTYIEADLKRTVHIAKFGVISGNPSLPVRLQAAVDWLPAGYELTGIGSDIELDQKVTITNKNLFRLRDGRWKWDHTDTNVFELVGALNRPEFINVEIYGDSVAHASRGAIGCSSGVNTTDWLVDNCDFNGIPFGVYFNADLSGLHKNPQCRNSRFRNIIRDTSADTSGIGNGLVFAHQSGEGIVNGKSINNVFEICGRHSLYITSGGNVDSIGDTFIRHRDDGSAIVTTDLAALHVARNSSNVTIDKPKFIECADLALAIQGVQTNSAQTFGSDVVVLDPTFNNNKRGDAIINNDSPTANGWINNVEIVRPKIIHKGEDSTARIILFAGINISVEDVKIEANLDEGTTELINIIRIEDTANVSQFNNIRVSRLNGTDDGGTAATQSRGVAVDAGILTGSYDVKLEDIDFGATRIFESATVPVNPNYLKLSRGKPVVFSAFTGSFTNQDAEINNCDKYAGKKIFSLSGGIIKPLYATGSLNTSTWVDGAGTLTHTPS